MDPIAAGDQLLNDLPNPALEHPPYTGEQTEQRLHSLLISRFAQADASIVSD